MNRQSQTKPKPATKRVQQASIGGILLTLLLAAITWWTGIGNKPAGQPGGINTPQVTLAIVLQTPAPTSTPTKKAATSVSSAAKPSATKTRPLAAAPTKVSTATPKAAKPATATPRPTQAPTKRPPATPTQTRAPTATPRPSPTAKRSGLPTITYSKLPRQAQHTIDLIDQGGPFPYDRDGIVFQNREGLLPRQSRNYYHEYTVVTPGESDRGARRIITGDHGELFYTDDHYASFQEVVR